MIDINVIREMVLRLAEGDDSYTQADFDREMKKQFPDRCHPGTQHHKLLADRLLLLCQT